MFCPNCGKPIKDTDNFCRYCGTDLRDNNNTQTQQITFSIEDNDDKGEIFENIVEEKPQETIEKSEELTIDSDNSEEYVLYDIKKHWMSLFLPAFLTPLFLAYFWNIFLNTHSLFSWIVVLAMLALIIYPVARFKKDKIIITNKFAHIKIGAINPEEIDIPISNFDIFDVTQTAMGRTLDYGTITFCINSEKYEYRYIESPEYIKHIFDEPKEFVKESL